MAIIGTDEDEDQKQAGQFAGSGTVIASGGGGTGQSGAIGAGGTGGNGAPGQSTGTGSSGSHYTNLSDYIKANQGTGINNTAGSLAGSMNQAAQNAEGRTADFSEKAWSDVNTGGATTGVSQDKLGAISGGIAGTDQGTLDKIKAGGAGETYAGPNSFDTSYKGPTSQALTDYASYKGPNDISSFGGATGNAKTAADQAVDTAYGQGNAYKNQGFSGLSGLLKNNYQQPTYTQGENSLDAALLGSDAGARATLGSAANRQTATQGTYGNLMTSLGSKIGAYKQQAADTAATYKSAVDNAAKDHTAADAYGAAVKSATDLATQHKTDRIAADQAAADKKKADELATAQAASKATPIADKYNDATNTPAPEPVSSGAKGINPNRNGNIAAPNPMTPKNLQKATDYAVQSTKDSLTNPQGFAQDTANQAKKNFNNLRKMKFGH